VDLDDYIAKSLTISSNNLGEWIQKNSEQKFREIELQILMDQLRNAKNQVIALGGGSLNELVLELVSKLGSNVKLIFLNTDFEICCQRIKEDSNRLLFNFDHQQLQDLYTKRMSLYLKADLILSPEDTKLIDGLSGLVHTLIKK
jgi:shikimate kinase